jgi:predicted nuclease of predicted toxin-antitoxin system
MKLLFDQNISYRIVKKVSHLFPGCLHVSGCGLSDAEDPDIWIFARKNGFTIVTFDADFYDLSLINGFPPKVIWIRAGNRSTNNIANLLNDHKNIIMDFIQSAGKEENSCLELE